MSEELKIELAELSHCPDAAKWAAAYKQTFPDADEGLMIGWFANAMMAMHDWKEAQIAPHFAALTGITDPAAFVQAARGMAEQLAWYADPANYRTFHDEDGDESVPCIPCDLTPADEGGMRLSIYDCGDRARAALTAFRAATGDMS